MISLKQGGTLLLLALLSLPSRLHAAPAPFDIDLKELERQKPAASPKPEKKKVQKGKKAPAETARIGKARRSSADNPDYARYTVKPGDTIFKILMVRFGMSNEAAERLIPEIIRINNISNIKSLTVGRTLLIPSKGQQKRAARSAKKEKTPKTEEASEAAAMLEKALKLEGQGAAGSPDVKTPGVHAAPPSEMENMPVAPAPAAPIAPVLAEPAPLAAPPVAAASPEIPAAPAIPPANTWICSVTESDSATIVGAVLNALSVSWSKNRIIQADEGAPTAFSIKVDRYFEYRGARYIVSIGESEPYSYTLIRLLEGAGYKVLRLSGGEDFKTACEKLLKLVGLVPDFGKHALQGGGETTGFLIQQDDAGARRVVITGDPVDPRQKWLMAPGCGAR
jgi:hypothetical protein